MNDTTYASGCMFKSNTSILTFVTSIRDCEDACRNNNKRQNKCSAYVAISSDQSSYFCNLMKGEFKIDDAIPFKLENTNENNKLEKIISICGLIKRL